MVKYGFILQDEGYAVPKTQLMECPGLEMKIVGVSTFPEACQQAKVLVAEGIDFIELCGAFEEEHCQEVIDAIDGKVPVGFVTYFAAEAEKFAKLFPDG
jgi:hypothetical protein